MQSSGLLAVPEQWVDLYQWQALGRWAGVAWFDRSADASWMARTERFCVADVQSTWSCTRSGGYVDRLVS